MACPGQFKCVYSKVYKWHPESLKQNWHQVLIYICCYSVNDYHVVFSGYNNTQAKSVCVTNHNTSFDVKNHYRTTSHVIEKLL